VVEVSIWLSLRESETREVLLDLVIRACRDLSLTFVKHAMRVECNAASAILTERLDVLKWWMPQNLYAVPDSSKSIKRRISLNDCPPIKFIDHEKKITNNTLKSYSSA